MTGKEIDERRILRVRSREACAVVEDTLVEARMTSGCSVKVFQSQFKTEVIFHYSGRWIQSVRIDQDNVGCRQIVDMIRAGVISTKAAIARKADVHTV